MVRIEERRTIGAVQSGLAALIVLGCLPSFEPPCSHRFYQAINFTTTSAFWSLQSAPRIPEPHNAKFVSCETSPLPPGSDSTTTCVGHVKSHVISVTKQNSPLSCSWRLPTSCSLPFAPITTDKPTNSFFVPPSRDKLPPRQISPNAESTCSCRPLLPDAAKPTAAEIHSVQSQCRVSIYLKLRKRTAT